MRSLVRILGILLLVFGCALWLAKPAETHVPPPPTVAATSPPPNPPKSKTRPSTRGEKPAVPPVAPTPKAEPISVPKSPASSTVSLNEHFGDGSGGYRFTIHLFKKDGWFDTRIPVTGGLNITHMCSPLVEQPPSCNSDVQAMIGNSVLPPQAIAQNSVASWRMAASNGIRETQTQFFPLPDDLTLTIKLRILPESGLDEATYLIRVFVVVPGEKESTAPALREQGLLQHWEAK